MNEHPRRDAPQDPAASSGHPAGHFELSEPVEPSAASRDVDRDAALVRRFFARERAAAPTLSADAVRWQAIVKASRGPRHPWLQYTLGAAAAAVVVGALGLAALGRGSTAPTPAAPTGSSAVVGSASVLPNPTTDGRQTLTPSTSQSVVAPRAFTPVPASFAVRSLTTASSGHLFALGTVGCAGGVCPALAGSTDNGASWRLLHTFPPSTTSTNSTFGHLGSSGTLTQVRFANPSVGWVFGGAAMRTTDGGTTWEEYPHPGGAVIDLETDGTDVVLTTVPSCTDGACHGGISVVRAPVTAPAAEDVAGTIDGGERVVDAQISWQGRHAFVSPQVVPAAGQAAPTPVALEVDGLHPAAPTSCGTGHGVRLVAPAADTALFAICPSGAAAGHLGYGLQASPDYGATWKQVPGGPLLLVDAGTSSFAAADQRTLLAASGGSPDLHGSMRLSRDGGVTWRDPRSSPPLPDHGWAWVGAPGGATFYALSGDGSGVFWKSSDRGETWSRVTVAGH